MLGSCRPDVSFELCSFRFSLLIDYIANTLSIWTAAIPLSTPFSRHSCCQCLQLDFNEICSCTIHAMQNCRRSILFLTGAPFSKSLTWTEADLSAPLLACFEGSPNPEPNRDLIFSNGICPSWRSVPFQSVHLPTGLAQASRGEETSFDDGQTDTDETPFLTTRDLSLTPTNIGNDQKLIPQISTNTDEVDEEVLSQYYEHSFAIHEEIASSQIVGREGSTDESFATDPEDLTLSFIDEVVTGEQYLVHQRLASGTVSDLREIPTAALLRSIVPQTMTVNLVLGVISISPTRSIRTRKGGRTVELVEILVGDDTRSGFGINIWLPAQESQLPREGDLRLSTAQLRCQDVIFVRNVALSTFRGKVYGQSLRRGMTTLDLLFRNKVDADDERGTFRARELDVAAVSDSRIAKIKRVKDWVIAFIGVNAESALPKLKVSASRVLEVLPADTQ